MQLVTHKKLKGGRLMPWGKGTVVTGAKGFVFLAGNTATTDDYEPFKKGGGAVGDAAAQWRNILTNIKSDLEELGTSLDHLIKLTFFVKGPFPAGGVLMIASLFLLSPYCPIFQRRPKRHVPYKIESHQQV